MSSIRLDPSWLAALADEFEKPYWKSLTDFVREEYRAKRCCPEGKNIFRCLDLTPLESVKVVILGQDPYHTPWAAMGLSFSVPSANTKSQPSLQNIFKELESDTGVQRINTDLTDWAAQGVLLLNSVLTVRAHEAASHAGKGWELFTDSVISAISERREGVVFILWGRFAQGKKPLIDGTKHLVIESAHPSPFSAHSGFFGSRPFSQANDYLEKHWRWGISWI